MTVDIANHEFTIIWDNIYYFVLSDYPNISDWELKKIVMFTAYEKEHNRETKIICDNDKIKRAVDYAIMNPEAFINIPKPIKITECTACRQNGCLTDFFCHTASIDDAKSILKCGSILSAVGARKKSSLELSAEPRNAASDPPDFFDYIMLSWGNCQAGDRLVMERMLGRAPDETDLSLRFKPGIRFYFTYDSIISHENYVNDGYHPAKVKNELTLSKYLHRCIIPEQYKPVFLNIIPDSVMERVIYVNYDCKDIWEWSEKVYNLIQHSTRR